MADLLKERFFVMASVENIGEIVQHYYPDFDKESFMALVFDEQWESKELKARMRHITICLHETLPDSYRTALEILKQTAPHIKGFEGMVFPDYVELYGLDDWETSLPALGYFTQFSSSEFAVRPFLDKNPERVMEYMLQWADDTDEHVRRFASEGCRPRLPWAMALPKFKKDPSLILPLLEKLKNDDSDFVRRSVANNLNDISKDHPELVLELCEDWYGQAKNTDWIVKHACRTMLKSGNTHAMRLFGYGDPSHIGVENLTLQKQSLPIGESLHFSFILRIDGEKPSTVRLEYAVYYLKANGTHSRKVFKISENTHAPGEHSFSQKRSCQDMSTRKHYAGTHHLGIIVNGVEMEKISFELCHSGESKP